MKHLFLLISFWGGLTCSISAQKETKDSSKVSKVDSLISKPLINNVTSTNTFDPHLLPSSPNAASLGKFGVIDITPFTGLANIGINVFSVSEGDIAINGSLRYFSGGVKPNEHPGWVGQNWSLAVGGIITRKANGGIDEVAASGFSNNNYSYLYHYDYLNVNDWYSDTKLPSIECLNTICVDLMPDEFMFTLPSGESGSFFLNHLGNWVVQSKNSAGFKVTVNTQNDVNLVNQTSTSPNKTLTLKRIIYTITITDAHGFNYTFGNNVDAIEFSRGARGAYNASNNEDVIANAWHLTRIQSPTNKEVYFNYVRKQYQYSQSVTYPVYGQGQVDLTKINLGTTCSGSLYELSKNIGHITSPVYLSSIASPSFSVNFTIHPTHELKYPYEADIENSRGSFYNTNGAWNYSDLEINGYTTPTPAMLNTYSKWYQLDSIVVKDGNGLSKERYSFVYNSDTTQRLTLVEFRKKANDFSINEIKHAFEYNTIALPTYNSLKTDRWGYFNNKEYPANAQSLSLTQLNSFLEVDTNYIQAGILKKIIYPTGGYTQFTFEANDFAKAIQKSSSGVKNGESISLINSNGLGDGVRIKKIIDYDNLGNTSNAKEYRYKFASNATSSGISAGLRKNRYDVVVGSGNYILASQQIITMNEQEALNYTDGKDIVYSEVSEQLLDGSSQIYTFANSDNATFIDQVPINTYSDVQTIETLVRAISPSSYSYPNFIHTSRALERGKLLSLETRNASGAAVRRLEYSYNSDPTRFDKFVRSIDYYESKVYCSPYTVKERYFFANKNYTYFPYLEIKKEYTYASNNPAMSVLSQENYTYNDNGLLSKVTTTDSKNRTLSTEYKYPNDFTVQPYLAMVAKNIVSPVIQQVDKLDNNQIAAHYTDYASFYYDSFFSPSKIRTQLDNSSPIIEQVNFTAYDIRANLLTYKLRSGLTTTFDWYTVDDIGKTDLVKSYTLAGGTTGTALARTINYEYIPLVGLSSTTDINGYTTTYNYDNFNRLASIKDAQGYLLAENFYHYANQTALTGLGISPNNASNYVVTRSAREAQTGTALDSDVTKTSTQVQYLDGLGRPLQTQLWKASPDQTKDLITATSLYDAFGRDYKHILPTPSNTNTAAFNNTAESLAQAFYGDNAPSTETVFEASPLNRPFKQFGAGQAWRTANKFTQFDYWITGSEVVRFDIQANGSVTGTRYPSSSLYNNVVTSERGIWTLEVKDKQGRVVSKLQQLEANTFNFATTDYVYNDLGQLSYVISPKIDSLFQAGAVSSFTEGDNVFLEGIYGYHYDNKGRLIEKHIPGAGWTRYVYDKNDRVVLENDDKDAAANPNYYKFTLYDALGRSIMSGTINNIAAFSRTKLQSDFDAVTTPYEERGTGLLGYTNRSFPSGYQPIDANVKSVSYYDDYAWQTDTTTYGFKSAYAYHTRGLTKGLVTGTLTRNLETNTWQKNVVYYDYKGKVIQDFHLTNRGNIIRKDYQYRFNGELLKTRITKGTSVKILIYEYDHVGRKTKFKHSLNGNERTIAKYIYDEIGRLKSKQFSPTSAIASLQTGNWTTTSTWQGGLLPTLSDNVSINAGHTITIPTGQTATAGSLYNAGTLQNYGTLNLGSLSGNATAGTLQTLDYKYHIRGGLLGINLDANNYLTNSIFSYKLAYEDDGTYYDGNIRNQYWKSTVDGIQRAYQYEYDGASRLTSAIYASTKSGETYALNSISYDNNGNIKTLSRNGATNVAFTSFGNVDNLVYTYQNNSNKLLKVQDGISGNTDLGDFRDGTNTDNDYEYWEDGSLKRDKNKAITITYNYLKLPKTITFDNTRTITTEYDAAGTKLKKIDSNGEITEYEEDEIYVNGNLYQISHDEGRIANGIYEYNITDHNNDLRIAIKDSVGLAVPTQSIFYDPWGLSMKGMQITRNASNYNKYQFLNRETQVETGYIDLIHRQYDPSIARFTSQDPIIEGQEHLSLYQYGWNNPILKPDPNGECPLCDVVNFAKGFNAAFVEDVFPIPVNLVNHGKGGSYGKGATAGHIVAALVGVGEVITGAGGEAGSAVVTVLSGGTAAPVAVPVALGSAVAIRHGVNTIDRATKSLKTANSKEEGSYTNTHESGKRYHGKGDKDRASESGEEKAKKYNDPLKSTDWTPASNTREAFKQESRRLDTDKVGNQAGHKNPNNYNKRNSPGAKYRKQDGDI